MARGDGREVEVDATERLGEVDLPEDERDAGRAPEAGGTGDGADGGPGPLARLGSRLRNPFSLRAFLVTLAVLVVGGLVGGAVPVVGSVGRFVGVFAGAFLLGLVGRSSRYLEVGVAGALATGAAFLVSALGTVLFPLVADYGVEIAAAGAGSGLLVALAGHYFGRDLRAGLTREV